MLRPAGSAALPSFGNQGFKLERDGSPLLFDLAETMCRDDSGRLIGRARFLEDASYLAMGGCAVPGMFSLPEPCGTTSTVPTGGMTASPPPTAKSPSTRKPGRRSCECGRCLPSFGMPGTRVGEARWCARCPGRPAAAVNVKIRRCECGKVGRQQVQGLNTADVSWM